MSVVNSTPLLLGDDGYQISRSVRLRSSASAYLQRTNATTGTDPLKFTVSGWIKRGLSTASYFPLLGSDTGSNAFDFIGFQGDNFVLRVRNSSSVDVVRIESTAVYRDFSAWYHLVAVYDSANAKSTERGRLYVNGVRITSFGTATYPPLNQGPTGDFLTDMQIGRTNTNSSNQNYGDGYLTEMNFIDGQALDPSYFGETDILTGVWKPKKYTGTYGSNGFYLNFLDNSAATAAAIGKDSSGNGNNWTPNNISVTAGATYDSMLDVPTMWADGGNGRGNYAVLNPLARTTSPQATLSAANLAISSPGTTDVTYGSIGVSSGKWYWEVTPTSATTNTMIGIGKDGGLFDFRSANGYAYWGLNGNKANSNNASLTYGAAYAANDVIGIALDLDAGTLTFYKNNVSQGVAYTGLSGMFFPMFSNAGGGASWTGNVNFGQRPFTYTPPTGFKALNTQNLPDPTIKKGNQYFDATTYTGNGGTDTPRSVGFKPDFLWVKQRSNNLAGDHILVDVMRLNASPNYPLELYSNLTLAEFNGGRVSAYSNWPSDGFAVNNDARTNANGSTYVAWSWKANGAPVSNTTGSITSQVSAGALQGISIATYTGTGANATVGHGLGVAPKMIIVKNRTGANNWAVYHANLTSAAYYLSLNQTIAQTSNNTLWNSTAPTSSVFSVGTAGDTNGNTNNLVAYAFSEIAGFSKFGSYTGNGSANGPFVYCGFRPRFVMWKRTNAVGSWIVMDTARDLSNVSSNYLVPNSSGAESALAVIDVTANGFKLRDATAGNNGSGDTHIFMAFAENPFKYSLAR